MTADSKIYLNKFIRKITKVNLMQKSFGMNID